MQNQTFQDIADSTFGETQNLRQPAEFGSTSASASPGTCLLNGSFVPESSNSTTSTAANSTSVKRCVCGAIDLDSPDATNGSHICSGSILEHWQQGRIQFPPEKPGDRQYVGLMLPRCRSRSKVSSSSLHKSRHKFAGSGKSRLPLDVDVNQFSPKTTGFKRIKLEGDASGTNELSSDLRSMENASKLQSLLMDGRKRKSTSTAHSIPTPSRSTVKSEDYNENMEDRPPPLYLLVPEYLGIPKYDGEPFIESARRGFQLFKQDFGEDMFDAAPGAGRDRYKNIDPCVESMNHLPGRNMDRQWTPFSSGIDILPRTIQTLPRHGVPLAEEGIKVEKINQSCNATVLQVENFAQTDAQMAKLYIQSWCSSNNRTLASDVGVGTHSDEDEKGPYTSIRTVKKNSVITLKSPPRPVTFSLPISSPRPTSSYSSHFCNSKSSLARPDSVATIPPLFSSLETFPPLSTAINIHTQETVQSNTTPSSTSLSAPISVLSKPRIPSLMDLKISLPANPSTSNADAIIITKRKGKPRLPTIADAFNQSLLNSPNLRSSKLKNRQLAIAVLPQN